MFLQTSEQRAESTFDFSQKTHSALVKMALAYTIDLLKWLL